MAKTLSDNYVMKRLTTKTALARNLAHLMSTMGWSQMDLHRASGVAQRTISNILNAKGSAQIDTVDELAQAFGLSGWHLIMQDLPKDIDRCKTIGKMIDNYSHSSDKDQDYINMVAERAATYVDSGDK